jgi:hypothetical protein
MEKTTEEKIMNNVPEQAQTEKPYTFRRLETKDIFPMFKLLNKIGLKELKNNESLKNIMFTFMGGTVSGKVDVNKVGIDMFLELACLITECVPKAEAEFYALLSQTSDRSVKDIEKQEPAVTFEMILDFIKKEEFSDFFKVVLKLFK